MNLFELSAKISVDDSGFKKSMENAQKVSKNVAAAVEQLQSPLDKAKSRFNAIAHPVETAKANIEKLKNATESIRHPIETLKNKVADASTALETKRNKLSALAAGYDSAKKKVADITKEFNKSAKESGTSSKKTQKLAKKLNEAEKEAEEAKKELDDYSASVSKAGKNSDSASKGVGNFASKLGKGIATAGKIGVAAVGAAAAGITALTTAAVNNYAEYEQLVGGVETLFGAGGKSIEEYAASTGRTIAEAQSDYDALMRSQSAVIENASNAYKTAGMSANEYMSTVTSFSASLLQSLGGDTEKAAEYANQALTDMSDNANKMGTSMEMIQNAYQGFAKQNYTMLDNLKLGYGGTKEEMARLIENAAKLSDTVDAQDMSFANIVKAINVVQTEMGITGTTAFEAGRTISGSVGAMKSAWTNLITGLADSNADIGKLVDNLVTTIVGDGTESNLGVLGNVMPAVKTALNGASKLVGELLPAIVQEIPAIINENLPVLAEAAISIIQSLVDGISQNQGLLMQTAFDTITYLATSIINMLPQIVALGLDLLVSLANGITNSLPTLIPTIVNVILEIVRILTDPTNLTNLLNAALAIVTKLAYGLMDAIPQLVQAVSKIIVSIAEFLINPANLANILKSALKVVVALATGIVNSIPALLSELPKLFGAIIDSFTDVDWASLGRNIIYGLLNGLANAWKSLVSWFSSALNNLISGVKSALGIRSPSRVFAGIGENMAIGLEKGWDDEFSSIKKNINKEMDFGVATVGVKQSYTHSNRSSGINSGVDRPITIVVQSVLDGKVIGETAYNYGRQKARATGT